MADIDLSSDFYFVFLFFNEELDSMLLCLPSLSPSHLLSFSMDFNKWRVIVSEQKIHVLAAILILFDSPVYYSGRIHAITHAGKHGNRVEFIKICHSV